MKKLFMLLAVAGCLSFATVNVYAQEADTVATEEVVAEEAVTEEAVTEEMAPVDSELNEETDIEGETMHQVLKQKFIEGDVLWMMLPLLCLIFGLAIAIERIIYLNLSTTNTQKLLQQVEDAIKQDGIEAAKEVCRNTRGPVASIFYQGLDRYEEGLDAVEKSVVSYGSVQMGRMETGLPWLSLFIAVAPMLGFMGTVVGMIAAFDAIQQAGDISPTLVAGGIKVALLTTLMGLIAAVILQLLYNYILSKIDSLVIAMEDSSISLVDILTDYNKSKK